MCFLSFSATVDGRYFASKSEMDLEHRSWHRDPPHPQISMLIKDGPFFSRTLPGRNFASWNLHGFINIEIGGAGVERWYLVEDTTSVVYCWLDAPVVLAKYLPSTVLKTMI